MNLKVFSDKYGIPYDIVYRSHFRCKHKSYDGGRTDIPEADIGQAVCAEMRHSIRFHMGKIKRFSEVLDKMKVVDWND